MFFPKHDLQSCHLRYKLISFWNGVYTFWKRVLHIYPIYNIYHTYHIYHVNLVLLQSCSDHNILTNLDPDMTEHTHMYICHTYICLSYIYICHTCIYIYTYIYIKRQRTSFPKLEFPHPAIPESNLPPAISHLHIASRSNLLPPGHVNQPPFLNAPP